MIPPQLQGNSLLKIIIALIYNVNTIINASETYNPFNRQRGIISINETRISVRGNAQAINWAIGLKNGDSAICSLKTEYSISLLIPVYRKSMINSRAITSTIVDLDSQVNERIRSNEFCF
ncbi:MAG: hypothetical protein ABI675_02895 [Chitinophagaceae bacterium]